MSMAEVLDQSGMPRGHGPLLQGPTCRMIFVGAGLAHEEIGLAVH